jgi:hypothetical protein
VRVSISLSSFFLSFLKDFQVRSGFFLSWTFFSGEEMANEQELERWATALVEASVLGNMAVCAKYGVTDRTLRNWRKWLKQQPRLRQLYEQKRARFSAELTDDLTARCAAAPVVILKGHESRHETREGNYSTFDLADAAAGEIEAVAVHCELPPVKAVERSHGLPTGHRIPLLVSHRDGSYTFCAVLRADVGATHDSSEHHAIGHLLFCYEAARMVYRAASSNIRLLVLADYDATALWFRAVTHVDVQIGFFNILEVVSARLSSQEVSAHKPAVPRRRRASSKTVGDYKCCQSSEQQKSS